MRRRQQAHSKEYVNRADVVVIGERGFRRVDDSLLQRFSIGGMQLILPVTSD
jgi:hypothetical protein